MRAQFGVIRLILDRFHPPALFRGVFGAWLMVARLYFQSFPAHISQTVPEHVEDLGGLEHREPAVAAGQHEESQELDDSEKAARKAAIV